MATDFEIEHVISNSKIIEKLEHRLEKLEEKIIGIDLIITKWLNWVYGACGLILITGGIIYKLIVWDIQKGIDSNDLLNDNQNKIIAQLQSQNEELRQNLSLLQQKFAIKFPSIPSQ